MAPRRFFSGTERKNAMTPNLLPLEIILALQSVAGAIICWILVFGSKDG